MPHMSLEFDTLISGRERRCGRSWPSRRLTPFMYALSGTTAHSISDKRWRLAEILLSIINLSLDFFFTRFLNQVSCEAKIIDKLCEVCLSRSSAEAHLTDTIFGLGLWRGKPMCRVILYACRRRIMT